MDAEREAYAELAEVAARTHLAGQERVVMRTEPPRAWDITTPEGAVEAYAEMSERQREDDATRTAAEQRVLDAMSCIGEAALRNLIDRYVGPTRAAAKAELARRGLK